MELVSELHPSFSTESLSQDTSPRDSCESVLHIKKKELTTVEMFQVDVLIEESPISQKVRKKLAYLNQLSGIRVSPRTPEPPDPSDPEYQNILAYLEEQAKWQTFLFKLEDKDIIEQAIEDASDPNFEERYPPLESFTPSSSGQDHQLPPSITGETEKVISPSSTETFSIALTSGDDIEIAIIKILIQKAHKIFFISPESHLVRFASEGENYSLYFYHFQYHGELIDWHDFKTLPTSIFVTKIMEVPQETGPSKTATVVSFHKKYFSIASQVLERRLFSNVDLTLTPLSTLQLPSKPLAHGGTPRPHSRKRSSKIEGSALSLITSFAGSNNPPGKQEIDDIIQGIYEYLGAPPESGLIEFKSHGENCSFYFYHFQVNEKQIDWSMLNKLSHSALSIFTTQVMDIPQNNGPTKKATVVSFQRENSHSALSVLRLLFPNARTLVPLSHRKQTGPSNVRLSPKRVPKEQARPGSVQISSEHLPQTQTEPDRAQIFETEFVPEQTEPSSAQISQKQALWKETGPNSARKGLCIPDFFRRHSTVYEPKKGAEDGFGAYALYAMSETFPALRETFEKRDSWEILKDIGWIFFGLNHLRKLEHRGVPFFFGLYMLGGWIFAPIANLITLFTEGLLKLISEMLGYGKDEVRRSYYAKERNDEHGNGGLYVRYKLTYGLLRLFEFAAEISRLLVRFVTSPIESAKSGWNSNYIFLGKYSYLLGILSAVISATLWAAIFVAAGPCVAFILGHFGLSLAPVSQTGLASFSAPLMSFLTTHFGIASTPAMVGAVATTTTLFTAAAPQAVRSLGEEMTISYGKK